mmetsp:Transcript_10974/g.16457  ORF Transcript_10974/g.16457 Transcript_10974/m.16457 type:complete len:252 (-) Transcript_10974:390-1145(-)
MSTVWGQICWKERVSGENQLFCELVRRRVKGERSNHKIVQEYTQTPGVNLRTSVLLFKHKLWWKIVESATVFRELSVYRPESGKAKITDDDALVGLIEKYIFELYITMNHTSTVNVLERVHKLTKKGTCSRFRHTRFSVQEIKKITTLSEFGDQKVFLSLTDMGNKLKNVGMGERGECNTLRLVPIRIVHHLDAHGATRGNLGALEDLAITTRTDRLCWIQDESTVERLAWILFCRFTSFSYSECKGSLQK